MILAVGWDRACLVRRTGGLASLANVPESEAAWAEVSRPGKQAGAEFNRRDTKSTAQRAYSFLMSPTPPVSGCRGLELLNYETR